MIYISENSISQTEPVTFSFDDFLWKWGGFDEVEQRSIVLITHPQVPHGVLFRYVLPEGVDNVEGVLMLPEFEGSVEYTDQNLKNIVTEDDPNTAEDESKGFWAMVKKLNPLKLFGW